MDANTPRAATGIDDADAWVARLHSPACTDAERAAFARWRTDHPEAAADCAHAEHVYALSGTLAGDPWLVAATRAAQQRARAPRGLRVPRLAWVAAAVLVLGLVGVLAWRIPFASAPAATRYATAVGEQRTLYFHDGTAVLLDTDTTVLVRYGARRREVTLVRGRAQFDVAADPGRPFRVQAGDGVIRDIGTRFQVGKRGGDVTVVLLRGAVDVSVPEVNSSRVLAPGQQVSYEGQQLGTVQPINLAAAQGWTRGEIVVDNRPLSELIAEMNRYSLYKLELGDPALGTLRISGVFHAGDQASLVQGLQRGWGVRVRNTSPQTIILEPAATH